MSDIEDSTEHAQEEYEHALAGEGEYWDNFIAQRLLRGEIPGSIDWRLTFSQFRYNHDWRPLSLGPQLVNFRLPEIRYVLERATPRPGMRVLDLGCGAGWLSLEMARRGAHVTGMDISPTNLALGRHMAETNARNFPYLYQRFAGLPCHLEQFGSVEYAYTDLNTVTLPASEYDAVVVWDSLHHVANLEGLLEQVRAALKSGGIFIGVDHAFATRRTNTFNQVALPWLDDLSAWISASDPMWLYEGARQLARQYDWGLLGVDYDNTPILGFKDFSEQLLGEMAEIIRGSLRQETPDKAYARTEGAREAPQAEEESPFEDVSALRVMSALLEEFHAERFYTVGPIVQPERHIPHYRGEEERIFQHYLAAMLVRIGEQAIARGQADGQWFLFHLLPSRPGPDQAQTFARYTRQEAEKPAYALHLEAELGRQSAELEERLGHITNLKAIISHQNITLADQQAALTILDTSLKERLDYVTRLELELESKNTELASLQGYARRLESELAEARKPRLPWKRRS
ncbi:MAG TPA: methyltransferase domain-containing protein [Chloroflexia bacterium]|nr:methyltransferase domain-containing protein [Chloroflexia bacterium]